MARFGRPGLLGTVARTAVITGTAQATSNAMQRKAAQSRSVTPPSDGSVTGPDLVATLQQLADLHTAGALTTEQFEAAKARVLGV